MKKIQDEKQYNALMKVLISQDVSSKDSVMKTVLINKIINYLFIKLSDDQRNIMLEMLKSGLNKEFIDFMNENLDQSDVDIILKTAGVEYAEIFNLALVRSTDGN